MSDPNDGWRVVANYRGGWSIWHCDDPLHLVGNYATKADARRAIARMTSRPNVALALGIMVLAATAIAAVLYALARWIGGAQ
jgi:hypothetical protein